MTILILVDSSLDMTRKTYCGLTKLEIASSLARSLFQHLFPSQKSDDDLFLFNSEIHLVNNLDLIAEFGHFSHGISFCRELKASPLCDLFKSLKTLLNLSRFLKKSNLVLSYAGNREMSAPSSVA